MGQINNPSDTLQTGTAILDFGDVPGPAAQVDVTGQDGIQATSKIRAWFQNDTMLFNSIADHQLASASIGLTGGSIVPGVGFTIYADSSFALWTKRFRIRWRWTR